MENLSKRIEAVLFVHGEPITLERLAKFLGADKTKIKQAAEELDKSLSGTALTLVWKDNSLQLATRPDFTKDVGALVSEEISGELSRASAETLAVVAYRGPITRAEIDYIRGVNSSYILRNLLIRGLIERKSNPKDGRTYIYQASFGFLKFLGLGKMDELPDYGEFTQRLGKFIETNSSED
ncbi:MAG: SMC-Scp complex subunit ScpB [Candidatus Niyogibacteria bacterium RIFCSPLOWO2_01_FULL_45_48]|uniref:SMC-Scp complex subunit ScpB n=2 Tax=Candidatus Niyogiibacteriota TaxID=1817912 RepID=A0A1G2F0R1_9BACT|nr:MAG: SMC-Scp complex subunit ScpB [Candidatus Niyogibacteria bacterium RIFCSPLOWO2_01_FULL_45_48]OGZ30552.1 MAG: SMC-Scp complex subunit ScpB [Candidatus Niyogibacteria bacterium RIFCSPHIGHO2_01_FULL_45_28]OGZ31654.1 MAG: SMC-Scp complex subunit ScpB [Candidatus Niyogibacteria bacterium RIFCSPLOWO2_02_FULL_45_13]